MTNRSFNNASVQKKSKNGRMAAMIELARVKGLKVEKNQFVPGWAVLFPNGGSYNPDTEEKLFSFIRDY